MLTMYEGVFQPEEMVVVVLVVLAIQLQRALAWGESARVEDP